ncbi:MAG: tetratricopeptide repeat protein [Chitinophagaceae bacterium]|nr:tetratricopeptide repeat protein [Chitinophagaceae bacterium]
MATNGIYLHLEESDKAVAQLMAQLSQIDKMAYEDSSQMNYRDWYWLFAAAMLLLLIAEFFIPERKNRRLLRTMPAVIPKAVVLLFVCLPGLLFSQQNKIAEKEIISGNEYYKQRLYQQAEKSYREALAAVPENFVVKYNLAAALYKQGKKVEAEKAFAEAAEYAVDRLSASKVWYNRGVILSRQKEIETSVEAYKNALRTNPGDNEARENLQKALLELRKKKSQEKKENDQQKKKEEQKQQPKMKPKEAEQRLRLLQQKEKEVQQRVQKEKLKGAGSQGKDW